jgi:hypothetical protein
MLLTFAYENYALRAKMLYFSILYSHKSQIINKFYGQ